MKLFNGYLDLILDFFLLVILFLISLKWHYSAFDNISNNIILIIVFISFGILAINKSLGFYEKVNNKTNSELKMRGFLALFFSLIFSYITLSYLKISIEDDHAFFAALFISVLIILSHRLYAFHAIKTRFLRYRILVYGSGQQAISVGKKLVNFDSSVDLVGYYTGLKETENKNSNCIFLTSKKSLTEHVREHKINEIVVALSERRGGSMPLRELLDCKLNGVRVVDMATHFEKKMGKISRDYISIGNLIFSEGFKQGMIRTLLKRIFDIIFSLILIVISMPILLVASCLIFLESGRPLIYSQERVGLHGKKFLIYKLRSMRHDAEEKDKPVWAVLKDARITRVGRVIRKFRIDELPQLFSVLSGRMSLVGPRPERHFFVQKLISELPFYEVRQSVKPGLTGWAQVRYHYGSSMEDAAEKLQYDLYYVKNHTIFLDFIVLFETINVVLTGKGAH